MQLDDEWTRLSRADQRDLVERVVDVAGHRYLGRLVAGPSQLRGGCFDLALGHQNVDVADLSCGERAVGTLRDVDALKRDDRNATRLQERRNAVQLGANRQIVKRRLGPNSPGL